eukprot:2039052-Lingulodinium_polyedra.AAC.1
MRPEQSSEVDEAMVGPLRSSMPDELPQAVEQIHELSLAHGCEPGQARRNLAEFYSPPRVIAEFGRMLKV